MSNNITEVKNEFITWRRSHGGKLHGLPVELQASALQLLKKHTWSEVNKQLNISNSSLCKWRKSKEVISIIKHINKADRSYDINPSKRNSCDTSQFVEISTPMLCATPTKEETQLKIKLETPNGFSLHIDGAMDGAFIKGLAQVVSQLKAR
jgi:putative lipoic acid-binding regulatory protein